MKLGDFTFVDDEGGQTDPAEAQRRFNATRTEYPRARTVHALFGEITAAGPDRVAVFHGERAWSYQELDDASNRVARLLVAEELSPEGCVAVLLEKTFEMTAALLGILKAGGAYVPLESAAPIERLRHQVDETGAGILIFERRFIRLANRLQWECPGLRLLLCADSRDVHAEDEGRGDMMREEVWDEVGRTMFDDISGGGWTSSYTGEWLSREVMDEYGDNALAKLRPYLHPGARVLEIACASGITMFRVAPHVGFYCGTDLSSGILGWTRMEVERRGAANIALHHCPAHEIDRLPERDFDVVILNSVVQCFSGHNYLRSVLRKALDLMKPQGVMFLGNLWDQDRKDEFVRSLEAFRRENLHRGFRVKVDRSEELFVSRAFLGDLRHDLPALAGIECSGMIGDARSELSDFGYDAVIRVDKAAAPPDRARVRRQLDLRAVEGIDAAPLPERTGPRGLAYVIYTSGTSGRPKGAMVEHRSIVRLVRNTTYVALGPDDRCLQTGSLAFDASTFEIWGMLLNGGAVSRPPERAVLDAAELRRLIRHHGITVMWLTSSLFNQHVDTDLELFAGLRCLLIGGEKLSPPHVNRVRQAYPGLTLVNGYGPTENTTFTTCHAIDGMSRGDVPIGRPVSNTQVWIVDPGGAAVPVGIPGEICAAGDGLARGYVADPGLTREKFVANPFEPGTRMYRTGDLGRWTESGVVEYLGRLDDQVKIRGFRVEPSEVAARMREHELVREAVVIARERPDDPASRELVGYVTGDAALDGDELRRTLRAVLPDYMVPAHVLRLERIPLTPNGKVDRRALPKPDRAGPDGARRREPPRTDTERALLAIWEETLGQQGLGIDDDFFESGGHSLKVARVMDLVQKRLGVSVPLTVLFRTPTVRALAGALLDLARFGVEEIDRPLLRLGGPEAAPPVFAFPPGTGDAAGFIQLAQAMTNCSFYAFNFIEAESRLRDYADLVSSIDPEGPYVFFGYSSGGNLAYHVAAEMERRGRRVAHIVMADSTRKVEHVPFASGEVRRIADEFLGHESIRQLLNTPVLRDRAYRLIETSYAWIERAVDLHTVGSAVHVLKAEDSAAEYRDGEGRLLASIAGWAEVARGGLKVYRAEGDHNHMLYQPYVDRNAEIIRDILSVAHAGGGGGR